MANHKSAKKRARQTIVRTQCNRSYLSKVKSAIKAFMVATESEKTSVEEQTKLFIKTQSLVQKAKSKGLFHKNKSARIVSKLYKHLPKTSASA